MNKELLEIIKTILAITLPCIKELIESKVVPYLSAKLMKRLMAKLTH